MCEFGNRSGEEVYHDICMYSMTLQVREVLDDSLIMALVPAPIVMPIVFVESHDLNG